MIIIITIILLLSARVDRMKEAKSEAEKIISTYKAEKESSYQAALGKQAVGSGSSSSVIDYYLSILFPFKFNKLISVLNPLFYIEYVDTSIDESLKPLFKLFCSSSNIFTSL